MSSVSVKHPHQDTTCDTARRCKGNSAEITVPVASNLNQTNAAVFVKHAQQGILSIESIDVLKVDSLDELGTLVEIIKMRGAKKQYLDTLRELESTIHNVTQLNTSRAKQ